MINWQDIVVELAAGAYALWEARKVRAHADTKLASLGGNLGPRVEQLQGDVAELRGMVKVLQAQVTGAERAGR